MLPICIIVMNIKQIRLINIHYRVKTFGLVCLIYIAQCCQDMLRKETG